jgi:hypothetical protein
MKAKKPNRDQHGGDAAQIALCRESQKKSDLLHEDQGG